MDYQLLAEFDELIKNFKGKYAILHDSDADGTTSAVITSHAMKQLHNIEPEWVFAQGGGAMEQNVIQLVQEKPVDLLITLDKPIDQDPKIVDKVLEHTRILCIDHHTINQDLSDKLLFIKSHFLMSEKPSAYATAKMVYDLFSRVTDLKHFDWIAAAGLIADAAYPKWKSFVDNILTEMNEPIPDDIFHSKLARVSKLVNAGLIYDKKLALEIYKTLLNSRNIDVFLDSPIKQYEQAVQDDTEYWVSNYKKLAEFHDDLDMIWYTIKPKFKIGSPVSTIVSMKYEPNKTVIVIQDLGENDLRLSFRRQDCKVDMAELANISTKGLENSNGGGHIPAAGGRIMRKDFEIWKERIFTYLKDNPA